jgi:hypothetical protein
MSTDYELEQAVLAMGDARTEIEDPDERRVARALILSWATAGPGLAANLAQVERMSWQERHDLWQRACHAVGVESPDDRRDRAAFETAQIDARRRRPPYRPTCAAGGCDRNPVDVNGMPVEISGVRRWWCPDHEHLAQAGDMGPPELPVDVHMRYVDPDETKRMERQDERIQQAQRERAAQRALRAAEAAEVERVKEERVKRELLGGQDFDGFS